MEKVSDNLETADGETSKVIVSRTPAELQRRRLEKLMKNPEKPVYIPEKRDEKLPRVFNPPEFIRNIWGSSAGVGSGDFHIYRNMRRRQYARERYQEYSDERKAKDQQYQEKLVENTKKAEERTAKKRQKRLKKKQKQKNKKQKKDSAPSASESESEESDEDDEATPQITTEDGKQVDEQNDEQNDEITKRKQDDGQNN